MFDKKKFINKFENDKSYWYIHQASIANNEERILFELELFKEFEGKIWDKKNQTAFRKELLKKNVARNRTKLKKEEDSNALVRGIKTKMQTLGLLWIKDSSKIAITSAGERFLKDNEFIKIIEHQLWKFIWSNPTQKKKIYHDTLLVPHVFLCEVLLEVEGNYITHNEYTLFVCKADTHDDLDQVVKDIREWRKIKIKQQEEILTRLKELKSSKRGESLFNSINRNKPYALGFFTNTTYLSNNEQKISITNNKKKLVEEKLKDFKANSNLIEFASLEDWIDFYGDFNKNYSALEALEYFESKAKVEKYRNKALDLFKKNRHLRNSQDAEEYKRKLLQEQEMHDYYEKYPSRIEDGLKLVPDGSKYQTNGAGEIDLLCKDKDGYVVVELKRNKASDKTIGQTLRYIGWVKENLCQNSKTKVRGIILSRSHEKKIIYAIKALPSGLLSFRETNFDVSTEEINYN